MLDIVRVLARRAEDRIDSLPDNPRGTVALIVLALTGSVIAFAALYVAVKVLGAAVAAVDNNVVFLGALALLTLYVVFTVIRWAWRQTERPDR
jgi:drug/metabolite transporter (DMT)-like permease